jgi:hypothetical protein
VVVDYDDLWREKRENISDGRGGDEEKDLLVMGPKLDIVCGEGARWSRVVGAWIE